jgi:hypothetical protein
MCRAERTQDTRATPRDPTPSGRSGADTHGGPFLDDDRQQEGGAGVPPPTEHSIGATRHLLIASSIPEGQPHGSTWAALEARQGWQVRAQAADAVGGPLSECEKTVMDVSKEEESINPRARVLRRIFMQALLSLAPRAQGGNAERGRSLAAPGAAPLWRYGTSVADAEYPEDDQQD